MPERKLGNTQRRREEELVENAAQQLASLLLKHLLFRRDSKKSKSKLSELTGKLKSL